MAKLTSKDELRGLEGTVAKTYFAVFDELILKQKDSFFFRARSRRPPPEHFYHKESGGVIMTDEARKKVLNAWQERKNEIITHPFLNEKIKFGLIPYTQSLLLARTLRGDLEAYPPFFWN